MMLGQDIKTNFTPGLVAPKTFDESYHIVISDGEVLCINGATPWRALNQDEWHGCGLESRSSHYLGALAGVPIFAEELDPDADEPDGYEFANLWSLLTSVEQPVFYLIGRAKQVVEWQQQHQHCGACGKPTSTEPDRSRRCAACKLVFYPRLAPSIIVLVHRGKELLLAKHLAARGNFYSTLAGFVEPGESIEETVHREVWEEVKIKIKNLRYFSSQPWPFPNSLMLGFHAEYESGEINIQQDEIADAQWFHYTNLPYRPAMMSISGWLIDDFIRSIQKTDSFSS